MCGMFGIIDVHSQLTMEEKEDFYSLALALTNLRGSDGTGYFTVNSASKEVTTFTTTEAGATLAREQRNFPPINILNNNIWFGHCRAASVGSVSKENTHPLTHDHIIGMQNGTLDAGYQQALGSMSTLFEVDSQHLFQSFANKGAKDALESVAGSAALIWANTLDGTVNIYRNSQRPLSIAVTYDGVLLFASELTHLRMLLLGIDKGYSVIKSVEPNVHHKIDMSTGVRTVENVTMPYTNYSFSRKRSFNRQPLSYATLLGAITATDQPTGDGESNTLSGDVELFQDGVYYVVRGLLTLPTGLVEIIGRYLDLEFSSKVIEVCDNGDYILQPSDIKLSGNDAIAFYEELSEFAITFFSPDPTINSLY